MEKRSTSTPRRRAARKCPSSWTKIEPPKKMTTRKIDQMLKKTEERRKEMGGVV
jgi:hypothetical protein